MRVVCLVMSLSCVSACVLDDALQEDATENLSQAMYSDAGAYDAGTTPPLYGPSMRRSAPAAECNTYSYYYPNPIMFFSCSCEQMTTYCSQPSCGGTCSRNYGQCAPTSSKSFFVGNPLANSGCDDTQRLSCQQYCDSACPKPVDC